MTTLKRPGDTGTVFASELEGRSLMDGLTAYTGAKRRPRPTDSEIRIPMPREVVVRVLPEGAHFHMRVSMTVEDVCGPPGQYAPIAADYRLTHYPCASEIVGAIAQLVAHEVKEQLGMDPHRIHPEGRPVDKHVVARTVTTKEEF